MWYRDSKTIYVPKLEWDIQYRSGGNITGFHHIEAARQAYPEEEIFEVTIPNKFVERTRIAADIGMDYGHSYGISGARCVLHEGHGGTIVNAHKSGWELFQTGDSGYSNLDAQTCQRLRDTLESISRLAATAADELLRSARLKETSWHVIKQAAINAVPIPVASPEYYHQLYASGNMKLQRCLTALTSTLMELQACKHSDESLSKSIWRAEQAAELLAIASDEHNDIVSRGKNAIYAAEFLDNTAWALRTAAKSPQKFTIEQNPFKA